VGISSLRDFATHLRLPTSRSHRSDAGRPQLARSSQLFGIGRGEHASLRPEWLASLVDAQPRRLCGSSPGWDESYATACGRRPRGRPTPSASPSPTVLRACSTRLYYSSGSTTERLTAAAAGKARRIGASSEGVFEPAAELPSWRIRQPRARASRALATGVRPTVRLYPPSWGQRLTYSPKRYGGTATAQSLSLLASRRLLCAGVIAPDAGRFRSPETPRAASAARGVRCRPRGRMRRGMTPEAAVLTRMGSRQPS